MKEIEVKLLEVNIDRLRRKLVELKAENIGLERVMTRAIFDVAEPADKVEWIRLRDEGNKTTLTYKYEESRSMSGMQEHEVEVSSFDEALTILQHSGLKQKSLQVTMRETWSLEGTLVEIDTWPHIPRIVEIEGASEQNIEDTIKKLELGGASRMYGSYDSVHEHYYEIGHGSEITCLPVLNFKEDLPAKFTKRILKD